MQRDRVQQLNRECSGKTPEEILRLAVEFFGAGKMAFASSFGAEDQVITDLICRKNLHVPVFTLDTGRLPQETHDLIDVTRDRYRMVISMLFPERAAIETMLTLYGSNLFYESVEKRKLCCSIRKVQVLTKKLSTLDAWVCGLRREQSVTRTGIDVVEWDANFGLCKINPLAEVSEAWVWDYIRMHKVPYNVLHDRGYPSIGCAPCSRPVMPDEDIRDGRWWWETAEHRECGLHRNDSEKTKEGL